MPQVFRSSSNAMVKISLVFSGLFLVTILLVGANVTAYTHSVGTALDQPAPFSHKHHVKELGLDCRYCHTGVEDSPFAGVPDTETCYTCHSQIWTNSPLLQVIRDSYTKDQPVEWNRVYNAPDFVYFDHSIHIAKGVGCESCHGDMTLQNLTYKAHAHEMIFCLTCHRNPQKELRPLDQVTTMPYEKPHDQLDQGMKFVEERKIDIHQIQNCTVCHR